MVAQQAPASTVVHTLQELRGNLTKTDVTIVGIFNNEYTNLIDTYMEAGSMTILHLLFFSRNTLWTYSFFLNSERVSRGLRVRARLEQSAEGDVRSEREHDGVGDARTLLLAIRGEGAQVQHRGSFTLLTTCKLPCIVCSFTVAVVVVGCRRTPLQMRSPSSSTNTTFLSLENSLKRTKRSATSTRNHLWLFSTPSTGPLITETVSHNPTCNKFINSSNSSVIGHSCFSNGILAI